MEKIEVKTSNDSYDIVIGKEILQQLSPYLEKYDKVLILSNDTIGQLYFEKFKKLFYNKKDIYYFTIPDGEKYKNIENIMKIYDFMIENNFSRKSVIITLGGGVICDMGGYTAATYMRGIDFIQIPTSLLAQVDASIGGKTAIDYPKGKNLIGVFKQPKLVLIDVEFLKTLPKEEFSSGMAEVIKHSIIDYGNSSEYFEFLQENTNLINALDSTMMIRMIKKSCEIKRDFVEKDEFEMGIRAFLNFGHTYGHCLEKVYNFQNITHGEGVAKGMMFSLELSKELYREFDDEFVNRVEKMMKDYDLDYAPVYINEDLMIETMRKDKKNSFDEISFVVLNDKKKIEKKSIEQKTLKKLINKFKNRYIRGIIDIGTNSCRIFVAEVEMTQENFIIHREILKRTSIVRLGEDVNRTSILKNSAIDRTLQCLSEYKKIFDEYGGSEIVAFATSATRDAKNKDEFLEKVRELGIEIGCISGDTEAQLGFLGNTLVYDGEILILDVGGGSTEMTYGYDKEIKFSQSIDIGAVRLTEMFFPNQDYNDENIGKCLNYIDEKVGDCIKELKDKEFRIIGVASATTQISVKKKLEIYNSKIVHNSVISLEELYMNLENFKSNFDKKIIGLDEKRKDIIIAGTLIIIRILELLKRDKVTVSESDNLNGAMVTKQILM